MQVTVKYFSALSSLTGKKEEVYHLPEKSTGFILLDRLTDDYPGIKKYKNHLRLSVNQEYRDFSASLQHHDELVFITPVSGG
jgi:molybdopterin converting factor small subunit